MTSNFNQNKIYNIFFLGIITGIVGCNSLSASSPAMPMTEEWQVLKVSDGDSLTVHQTNGQEKKLRLCGIDAPEKRQPLGDKSKANLQRLSDEVGGTVQVIEVESDRYGRTVAEVFSSKNGQDKFWNEEQLSSGNAYLYAQYAGKCPNVIALRNGEAIAKSKRLGVWSSNYQKPWDYRKQQRQR